MKKPVLDHIGIAVRSIEEARIYRALGLDVDHVETVASQGVRTAFLPVGDSNIELLEPTSADTSVGRFIEKRGEGIHHICLRVDDIEAHLERLREEGFRLINESPVPGAHGCRVAFLHPAAGNGVLIELSEKSE
jgi:methylmalonyl-CoA/ethylmalonyl-CoA epimerase